MTKNILPKISDIIKYLKEAGFSAAADKMQECMDMFNEDCVLDPFSCSNDVQLGRGNRSHGFGPAGPALLSVDVGRVVAQKLVDMANGLDSKGCYEEANQLDNILADINDMMKVIKRLDKSNKKKKVKEKSKQKEDVAARSNGKKIDEVSNQFSGFSDAYFYSHYGNLEGAYGPTDR